MERILFINPPNVTFNDFINPSYSALNKGIKHLGNVLTDMPLGIISMSAYLKKHFPVETKLVDFNVILNRLTQFDYRSFEKFLYDFFLVSGLRDFAPKIVGISVLFAPAYRNSLDIARVCHDIFPKALIVAGGGVPTGAYKEMFRDSDYFDGLCYGEGEKPLLGLVKAEDKRAYLEESSSWITRRKLGKKQSFKQDFIENLDEIPFYDYEMLDIDGYGLDPVITTFFSIKEKSQNFHMSTSRGCPFGCCFCSSSSVHGRRMRYHSIKRIGEDLDRLKRQFGARIIVFQDDHFLSDRERAIEILKIVKDLKVIPVFQSGLALYALDRKMLELLKEAGVNPIVLSVESGSNRVLKEIMHKPLDLSIVNRVINDCNDLGIHTDVNILIGLPGATKKDIEDTRAFLRTIKADRFRINRAVPLVGSEMLDICIRKGYVKEDYLNANFKKAIIETEDFTSKYIEEIAYVMNLELNFVFNNNYCSGNYEIALKGFENAIRAKNDHAIAYYYAAKCYERLGQLEKAKQYMEKAKTNAKKPFWNKYFRMFNIPI
ncbi:MAG: radical SAM protein [Candidatus Omnitrophica bacterium]|nr:radical SAM protein [Candidatus Omnitrophota bacterium]MCM8788188.1 radical SAM protein [Candidatus Omnitrophota bacterium]